MVLTFSMGALVSAATTPSVEAKEAPTVVETKGESGNQIVATIDNNTTGETVEEVGSSELVLTPISEADKAPTPEITNNLVNSYNEIKDVASFDDAIPGFNNTVKQIMQDNADEGKEVSDDEAKDTAENYVLSDIFDMSLIGEKKQVLNDNDDHSINLTLRTQTNLKNKNPIVTQKHEGKDWNIIDPKDVTVGESGYELSVKLPHLSVIAVFVEPDTTIITDPDVESPKTADPTFFVTVAMIASGSALSALAIKKRKF